MATGTLTSLAPAHRGYLYQDLVSAIAIVDTMLSSAAEAVIDRKLFNGDLFDDLTLRNGSHRHRLQLKYSADADAELNPKLFGGNSRGVRLDLVISAMLADRATFPTEADRTTYRIVFTDHLPPSKEFENLLVRGESSGLSWPLAALATRAQQFDPSHLWRLRSQGGKPGSVANALSSLRQVARDDLEWACARLFVETSAPQFSGDLLSPGPAEAVLLQRVRNEVGAGSFPNAERSPVDVAAQLIAAVQSARTGIGDVSAETLIRRTQLRTDFGAVSAATPVITDREVNRDALVESLVSRVEAESESGGALIVLGPPGQGKSWVSDQVASRLEAEGWLVASHYCYLGEADRERNDRVMVDSIFGSLLARLAEADGTLVSDNLPKFTADRGALEQVLRRASGVRSRKMALLVDGLDHISRVIRSRRSSNPSLTVCESLALLELPPNVVLVILSQPGDHLAPFAGSGQIEIPGMGRKELTELGARLLGGDDQADGSEPHFVDALVERSGGNALYATYLCLESSRRDVTRFPTRAEMISSLPAHDGTLKRYYEYLYQELDAEGWVVAEELALTNFAMTRSELQQLRNPSRVDAALRVLSPVLREQAGSGIRFYHESFGRFVRDRLMEHPAEARALLCTISDWLGAQGFLEDERAFRWLLPTLGEQDRHADVLALIDDNFVEAAIARAFPVRWVLVNLEQAAESAALLADWPQAVRLIQMANSAHMFDFDRFELLVDFTDVQTNFVSAQQIANRLLEGDRLLVTGRQGVLRCAAVDAAGAVAPWEECLAAYQRELEHDNVHRGDADERQVALAVFRGHLRLASIERSASDLKWENAAADVDRLDLPIATVVDVIEDVVGIEHVAALAEHSRSRDHLLIELAERAPEHRGSALSRIKGHRRKTSGATPGTAHRAIALGLDDSAVWESHSELRERLLAQTQRVLSGPSSSTPHALEEWLDSCAYAARIDPVGLNAAEAIVDGAGWYRCWLRFAIELVRVESIEDDQQARRALDMLGILEEETNPFRGKPRAVDLYFAHDTIAETIKRALGLVAPADWGEALEKLSRVSRTTSTVGMGFVSGPLVADVLANIAASVSPEHARDQLRTLLSQQIEDAGADTTYPEVAGRHLRIARHELAYGEDSKAADHWLASIALLTAYGEHKDATIYEITEPLELLASLDLSKARRALQRLQPITLAVGHHTDGRGTSRVHADWWQEAARLDPVWLIDLALPELADHVNSSHWALQRAVEEVWNAHHQKVDPRISAAGRIVVDTPLMDADAADLSRYLEAGIMDQPGGRDLVLAVMSRLDERATSSTYTNEKEILEEAEQLVDQTSDAAERGGLPRVAPVRPIRLKNKREDPWGVSSLRSSKTMTAGEETALSRTFSPGLPGIYEAIQSIRNERGSSERTGHGPDQYQNSIGYRLVELDTAGRGGDAEEALFALADALPFGETPSLLASLSYGFVRLGRVRLAAVAGVLAWTRANHRGGWRSFGEKTHVEHLASAFDQDDQTAREVLGKELSRRAVGTSAIGPTGALIYAAGAGALPWSDGPADAAIRCWESACDVVERRTPIFLASDVPEHPYNAGDPAGLSEADLARCVAAVALAKVCSPSRELKRRSLVAIRDLLTHNADAIARDLAAVLPRLSDPITQYAVLEVALEVPSVIDGLEVAVAKLAMSPLLSIRTLARRHIEHPPELPYCSPPNELISTMRPSIGNPPPDRMAESLVAEFLAARLDSAEEHMPELETAVTMRMADDQVASACRERVTAQLDSLATRAGPRWPDAVLGHEEETERQMQHVAGAYRIARIMIGEPVDRPADWELEVGTRLAPRTRIALELESTRIPRPNLPAAPLPEDPAWNAGASGSWIHDVDGLAGTDILGWSCIGFEELRVYASSTRTTNDEFSTTVGGLYAGDPDPGDFPLGRGSLRWWYDVGLQTAMPPFSVPLVARSSDESRATGLGAPRTVLAPTPLLRSILRLVPSARPFSMVDPSGEEAVRLVVWRAEYDVSDYELTFPKVHGQALLLRPDLVATVESALAGTMRFPLTRFLFAAPREEAG